MGLVDAFMKMLRNPAIGEFMVGVFVFMGPVWIAFLFGLLVGWAWKPAWATSLVSKFQFLSPALVSASMDLASTHTSDILKLQTKSFDSSVMDVGSNKEQLIKLKYQDNSTLR